jgi:hypothetical protein
LFLSPESVLERGSCNRSQELSRIMLAAQLLLAQIASLFSLASAVKPD